MNTLTDVLGNERQIQRTYPDGSFDHPLMDRQEERMNARIRRAPKALRTTPEVDPYKHLHRSHADLPDGRRVSFFVNVETNLIVVDVIDADEQRGVEILRRTV